MSGLMLECICGSCVFMTPYLFVLLTSSALALAREKNSDIEFSL